MSKTAGGPKGEWGRGAKEGSASAAKRRVKVGKSRKRVIEKRDMPRRLIQATGFPAP